MVRVSYYVQVTIYFGLLRRPISLKLPFILRRTEKKHAGQMRASKIFDGKNAEEEDSKEKQDDVLPTTSQWVNYFLQKSAHVHFRNLLNLRLLFILRFLTRKVVLRLFSLVKKDHKTTFLVKISVENNYYIVYYCIIIFSFLGHSAHYLQRTKPLKSNNKKMLKLK